MAKAIRHMGRIWQDRTLYARRACVAACIASTVVTGVPLNSQAFADDSPELLMPSAVVHAVADQGNATGGQILQVADKHNAPPRAKPSSAKSTNEPRASAKPQESFVAPVAGVLDGWFGGQTKVAKKESEDGRKATALPPPDPSTVDWKGVPFHQPKRSSSTATDETASAEPIRDLQKGASAPVPSSTANLRRPTTNPTTTSRSASATPSRPVSATNRSSSPSLPPSLPTSRSVPKPQDISTDSKSDYSASPSKSSTAADISGSSSTRRSGRQPVNALNAESFVESPNDVAEVRTEPVLMAPEATPAPTVQRRELKPVETIAALPKSNESKEIVQDLPKLPATSVTANNTPAPKTAAPQLVPVPESSPMLETAKSAKSLEDNWKSVGSGLGETKPATRPSVTATPATPVATPLAAAATTPAATIPAAAIPAAAIPAATIPLATTPVPTAPESTTPSPTTPSATELTPQIPGAAVAKSESANPAPAVPSAASEKILREQLTREQATVARKSEPSSKQLAASEIPGVRVVTEGPSEIMIRELTQYEVRVENRGSVDATGIIVRSSLPAWAEVQGQNASVGAVKTVDQSGSPQLQWTIDKLPAGIVERMFVRVKAVRAGTFDVATDWTLMPQKHTAKVTVREPKLAIAIDGPDEIVFGESEKYRVRVMNPGDGDAANVMFVLSPDSTSPQAQKIGNIPAGKEAQFEIELTARELGELKIGGVATADREVKTNANKSIRIAAANLEAELTGPPLKYQNSEATYHLYITNTGKAICQTMDAELRLPAGAKYVSGIQQASMQGDRLTWKIESMQPGAVREYDVNLQLDRTGDMVIGFNCVGSAAGKTSVSIETRVEAIADLVLSISDPVAPAPVNAEVVYEMTILNRGSKAAEDVRIIAQFSDGIEPIKIEGQAGEVLTGQAMFSPITRIEPGSSVRLKVIATANRAGDHRFRAEVRHGETSLVAEEATMFMNAPAERISRRSKDNK